MKCFQILGKIKNQNGEITFRMMYYVLLFHMLGVLKLWRKKRFGMKGCLSLLGLGRRYFNSMGTEEDEPIYTYNDKYMRRFVRQSTEGWRFFAFIHYYYSKFSGVVSKIISEDLNVKGNVCDVVEVFVRPKSNHLKNFEEEYECNFDQYKKINEDENVNILIKN